MATNNGDSNSSPNPSSSTPVPNLSTSRPELPPVLKRSKTISGEPRTLHFPTVRRVSTSPPSLINSSRTSPSSTTTTTSTTVSDHAFNFGDRDYVYPSFLGPYASRSRGTVKSAASRKNTGNGNEQQSLDQFSSRRTSMPSNLTVDVGSTMEPVHSMASLRPPPRPGKLKSEPKPKPMAKLKGEKDLNPLSVHVPATSSSFSSTTTASASSYSPRKSPRYRSSWILNLVGLFLVFVSLL